MNTSRTDQLCNVEPLGESAGVTAAGIPATRPGASAAEPLDWIARCRTPYQQVAIARHPRFGVQLYIDGDLQISASDHAYAAAMVAPVLNAAPLKEVLILGGGDGGVLAEVLAAADAAGQPLQRTVMVDIDRQVVELCQQHLPQLCAGAYEDPRSELVIDDALAYLEDSGGLDAVVYDLTFDPVRDGVGRGEFIEQTIESMARSLRPGGAVSMQCCGVGATTDGDEAGHREVLEAVRAATERDFVDVAEQQVMIPSYEGLWTFVSGYRR